jgi:hypothetical protein
MFFVSPEQSILDDGYEMQTAPAYGLNQDGTRYELDSEYAFQLTRRWIDSRKGRFPLGNAVARVTKSVGIEPCEPCEQRQHALNQLGDRAVAMASKVGWWWAK